MKSKTTATMATVEEWFQPRTSGHTGDIGVEIEVEGTNLPHPERLMSQWRYERDGSLRGEAIEYVFEHPMTRDHSVAAIEALKRAFVTNNSTVNDSMRAGVHVHVNVNKLTVKQLMVFISCYYILEECIVRAAGKSRQGNLFALRLVDAYEPILRLRDFLSSGLRGSLLTDELRYAALNLASVGKYGSVEFRSLRTPTDFSTIVPWIDLYLTIRDNSTKMFDSPSDVVTQFSGGGERQFVTDLLGDDLANRFIFCYEDFAKSCRRGSRFVQDYAFLLGSKEDWEARFNKSNIEPRLTIRRLPTRGISVTTTATEWGPTELEEMEFVPTPEGDDEDSF